MAIWQGESVRKPTGGRRKSARKKRKSEIGRETVLTTIGPSQRRAIRVRGGAIRIRVLRATQASVTDPKTGKTVVAEIKTVLENPANPNYVRRNVITKGAIVQTTVGKARVTSRPGQDGTINAVLLE